MSLESEDPCECRLRRCRNLLNEFETGVLYFDEYVLEFASIVADPSHECMRRCVESVPYDLLKRVAEHPAIATGDDHRMGSPQCYLVGRATNDEIEAMRRKLAPRYAMVRRLISERVASHRPAGAE